MHLLSQCVSSCTAPLRSGLLMHRIPAVLAFLIASLLTIPDGRKTQDDGASDQGVMPVRTNVSAPPSSIPVKSGTYREEAYRFVIPNRFLELKFDI